MTYPPQQPENGWSDQSDHPVDPFASGGDGQSAAHVAHGQQQGQAPQYEEPATDQTQAIQVQPHANPYQQQYQQPYQQPQAQPYQADPQQVPQQHANPYQQQYQQPAAPQADPYQQQGQDPYQQQADPYQPQVDPQQHVNPYQQQYQQPADPYQQQGQDPYQQQPAADPYQQQGQPVADPYQQQGQDPYQQQPAADPFQQQQQADPYQQQYQQPVDPYQQQAPAQQQQQAFGPPNVYQPAEPETRPVNFGQPGVAPTSASPASAQPYSAGPTSGQPTSGGVPESPFAAAPTPKHLPAPVSASPTSGEPWGTNPVPQFTPKQKSSRGVPGWAYIVGVIVVVLALGVGGSFYFGVFDGVGKPTAEETKKTEKEPEHEPQPVTDSESGLTYMSMPQPWTTLSDIEGFSGVSGFASVTGQGYVDDSGDLNGLGVIAVGQLDSSAVDYENVDSLAPSTEAWADEIDAKHWKNPADPEKMLKVERDDPLELANLRVDGRRAVTGSYHVTWTSESTSETGASVYLVIVDQGDGNASGFMTVVPDSLAADQSKLAETAMLSLQYE